MRRFCPPTWWRCLGIKFLGAIFAISSEKLCTVDISLMIGIDCCVQRTWNCTCRKNCWMKWICIRSSPKRKVFFLIIVCFVVFPFFFCFFERENTWGPSVGEGFSLNPRKFANHKNNFSGDATCTTFLLGFFWCWRQQLNNIVLVICDPEANLFFCTFVCISFFVIQQQVIISLNPRQLWSTMNTSHTLTS